MPTIIKHGSFQLYRPEPSEDNPITLIPGVLFTKNSQDLDFYEVKKAIPDEALVVLTAKDGNVVEGASRGPLMAFPQNGQRLYSIYPAPEGVTPEQALGKTLDPANGTLAP